MEEEKLTLEYLNPDKCVFTRNEHGFITLCLDGKSLGRVKLTRAYPHKLPDDYIGVSDIEDNEIGMLKSLSELSADSRLCAENELSSRYFCPRIDEIKSIKEKMGSFYFDVKLGEREKSFTVKDISRNIRLTQNGSIMIFDVDGNRYEIPGYDKLKTKTKRLLEPYLY